MAIVLFDNRNRKSFFPLTATRAIASLRMGMFTIQERWSKITGEDVFVYTVDYLKPLYENIPEGEHLWIDSSVIVSDELLASINSLKLNEALMDSQGLVAGKTNHSPDFFDTVHNLNGFESLKAIEVKRLEFPQQIFQLNNHFIKSDFKLITANRVSEPISLTNNLINPDDIFIEEGVTMEYCTLNATAGPIYIGKYATLMEGCLIRGSFSMCNNSLMKMGSKMYGATTIGPNCLIGGEVKNIVMQGNSNKAHDGYLGDSVIGEWCNFGAGASNSNVKNTGGEVHLWNYAFNGKIPAGQKCGLIMGDYSRVAINSCINTGSVIGVCANVFGAGLLPTVIKDFSWGINEQYIFEKALSDINNWTKMKHHDLSQEEIDVLRAIFGGV